MRKIIIPLFAIVLLSAACGANSESTNDSSNSATLSESVLLKEADLEGLSAEELRLMRNEIFARHGYIFKDKTLTEYFSKFDWYKPVHEDVTAMLSETEQKNSELIKMIEAKAKAASGESTEATKFEDFVNLFTKVEKTPFVISNADWTKNKPKAISDADAKKYLDATIEYVPEMDCKSYNYSTVIRFDIPERELDLIGLVVHESVCPMPAIYDEFILYVFTTEGKLIDKKNIAYSRGGVGDLELSEAVWDGKKIIRNVEIETGEEEDNGLELTTTKKTFEIIFDLEGSMIETEIKKKGGKERG